MRQAVIVRDPDWRPAGSVSLHNSALQRALAALEGRTGRALEVGAGTARFLRAVTARRPGLVAHACDLDRAALAAAQRADARLTAVQGDLTALPYRDGAFDVVMLFDVLEHLNDPDTGMAEIARITTKGGLLHALIPCEGQPLTLHWLLWKARLKSDLKERIVGHVQRFTHGSAERLLERHGFTLVRRDYSMHPLGQAKDVLSYLQADRRSPWWLRRNPLLRAAGMGLWLGSYVESALLKRVPLSAVTLHVTAVRQ